MSLLINTKKASVLCTFVLSSLSMAAANAQNLVDAYQAALNSNPQLAQAKHQLEANQQLKPLTQSAYLPHVNAGADAGRNRSYISPLAAGGTATQGVFPTDAYSVTLTQAIFNGQALAAMNQADDLIKASEQNYLSAQQVLVRQVTRAYFSILQTKSQLAVASEAEQLLRNIKEQAEENLRVGTGDIISVNEAKARWQSAIANQINARNALSIAYSQLQKLTHQERINDVADLSQFMPLGPKPDDMEQWVNQALTNQPLIHQAEEQVKAAQAQVEINRRARWPVVNLNGVGSHVRGQTFPDLTTNQASAIVTLSIPLIDGGQISAQVGEAHSLARAQEDQLNDIKDQVTFNTRQAFLDLKNSVASYEAAKATLDSAKLSLEGTRAGFGIGTRSMIDLLTTATDYIQAEASFYDARYQHILSRMELKFAVGILNEQDINAINQLLSEKHS
ncbi:MAG: TolC family outer membrane protein [Betaproteobacteria bacterium]|nr:TolC family outer membrane protein [Betaproteobacteria bacterium]